MKRNRWNRNQQHRNVAFNPYRPIFNCNVEIDYSSLQVVAIWPMNVVCQFYEAFMFKNEALGLCGANGKVKLTPPEPLHSLVSGNGPDSRHFWLIFSNTIIVYKSRRHLVQQKLFEKIVCQQQFRAKYQYCGTTPNLISST